MNLVETLVARNETFATSHFDAQLKILPKLKTLIVGCVDPRVDPYEVFGLAQGEAAIIRNVGGRITPALLLELDLLREVSKASGGDLGPGWNLVVLHHTDCGIKRLDGVPALMGQFFDVAPPELPSRHVHDPRASVALDIESLRAHRSLSDQLTVSGLVYDVTTGRLETIVPPTPLRA